VIALSVALYLVIGLIVASMLDLDVIAVLVWPVIVAFVCCERMFFK
jgi:hypothetical protein